MKSLKEILKQNPVYLHNWEDEKKKGVADDFEEKEILKTNVLFAVYDYVSYDGEAWVLFEKNGSLYKVYGAHCSCYGLEGQWEPEETNLEVLKHRLLEGELGIGYDEQNIFAKELKKFTGIKESD